MSKRANPTLIGTFVLIALAVAVLAVMALSKFNFRDDSVRCVAYFSGSMHGLDVGAPVAFRGVTIGRVTSIELDYDTESGEVVIPVYMALRQDLAPGDTAYNADIMRRTFKHMIEEQGLKAQMETNSLLTGKQYVELSLKPNQKPSLHGIAPPGVLEIPTMSSGLSRITETLEKLPLQEILGKLTKSLDSLNNSFTSEKAGETLKGLMNAVQQLDTLLTQLNQTLPKTLGNVSQSITQGVGEFSSTMKTANTLLGEARKELKPISADLHKILVNIQTSSKKLDHTLSHLERMTANVERMTAKDSEVRYQLRDTLHEVRQTAGSLRDLSEYLRQNPNALLFGEEKRK